MKHTLNLRRSLLSGFFSSSLALSAAPSVAAQFFVSPSGSDASAGTRAAPFASPQRARDAVREALQRGEPCEVVLRGGTYELAAPLELGAADSGSAARPVTWRAADREAVRLSAGRSVTGWKPVSDAQVLARLDPSARSRVLQVDIKALGITEYGEMDGGFSRGGGPGIELFLDDLPAHVSRYPNAGFITITEALGATPADIGGVKGSKEGVLRVADERARRWAAEEDARAFGYFAWDWADDRQKITSIDPATLTLKVERPGYDWGYRKGQYFYAFNLLSEIDAPGEWFLDRGKGLLYALPLGQGAPRRSMVSVLPSAITVDGASFIRLRGLTIEGARGTAVSIKNSTGVALIGCVIRNSGSWAVRVEGGSTCSVRGCDITGLGDGGVSLGGGDRRALTASAHLVENCHIHHYSRWNRTYRPGIDLDGVGNRAARNLIDHAPHEAMSFQGNDHSIEGNEIHNVCEETNDAGAIYSGRDWTRRGHVIRHNYLHHIYGKDAKGANGVYLDDCLAAATIENNIFEEQVRPIHIGGGRDNIVSNNLFVNCRSALHIDARGLGWAAASFPDMKQKLEAMPYQSPPWSTRYPKLVGILGDEPMAPKGNLVERNVMVTSQWDDIEKKALPYITMRNNLLDAPASLLARGPIAMSLGIEKKLPAWEASPTPPSLRTDASTKAISYVPISPEGIGVYSNAERARWPVAHKVDVQEWPQDGSGIAARTEPPLSVARVAKAPKLDGVVSLGEYAGAPVSLAETPGRTKIEKNPARAWLSHDGKYLYVAVSVPVTRPQSLRAEGGWGAADGLEIALRKSGGAEKKPGPTFVLQGFPDGRSNASTDAGAEAAASGELLRASKYAAKVGGGAWVAEWAIPLERFGTALGFNIGVRRTESDEWLAWTGTTAQNWKLEGAGKLALQ